MANTDPRSFAGLGSFLLRSLMDEGVVTKDTPPEVLKNILGTAYHETFFFRRLEENIKKEPANKTYKNINGNTEPNDGYKYRGRGFVQLTGKGNYKLMGDRLGIDLVGSPELASDLKVAAQIYASWIKNSPVNNKGIENFNTFEGAVSAINPKERGKQLNQRRTNINNYAGKNTKEWADSIFTRLDQVTPEMEIEKAENENLKSKLNQFYNPPIPKEKPSNTTANQTDRMLDNNKMDEQEINAGDQSLANQRDIQRKTTKEQSGFNLIRPAEGADLETIDRTVREELNKAAPIDADDTKDRMGVTTPPTNAASDAFQADQMMEDYNTVNEDENLFRGSMNEDTEVEPLGDMSYPEGYTEYDSLNNATDEQEFDELDDTVVDREGMDYSEPEGVADISFFESLFNDVGMGDFTTEQDYNSEADTLNLNEGGHVEKEVDFVKDKESVEDSDNGDPPPGATPEEVADDVPAMLSEGEYVLPANVVRYLGLERVISMHRRVLSEIQQMEDLGMIQNVDEDGKPEDDDNEMKFSDKKPKSGSIEIVVASSKPKGIMSFDAGGGMLELDIGADPYVEPEPYDPDPAPYYEPNTERDPDPTIFQSPANLSAGVFGDVGGEAGSSDFDINKNPGFAYMNNVTEPDEMYNRFLSNLYGGTDYGPFGDGKNKIMTGEEKNTVLREAAMASIDQDKIKNQTTNMYERNLNNLKKSDPKTGEFIDGILGLVNVGKFVKGLEAFEGFMRDKRMEARNSAAARVEARAKAENITDPVKINKMKQDAMNSAWSSLGFSRAEDLAWAGGASEMIPDDYGNNYEDGRDGTTPTRNNPEGVVSKFLNDLKRGGRDGLLSTTLAMDSLSGIPASKSGSPSTNNDDLSNQYEFDKFGKRITKKTKVSQLIDPALSRSSSLQEMSPGFMGEVNYNPKSMGFASGGLMQKKKFNQGGAYIEGVGYRDLTEPLTVEGAFNTEVKSYEDVIAEMQGFTGKDKFPEERILKGKEYKKRRQQARRLPRIDATTIDPKISRRDPYLQLQLKNAGVDTENYGAVVEAYSRGDTKILGSGSAAANRQLISQLDNYTEGKRMQYDGFTQKDLNNLPEGSTNKDALKKIFSTEIQFRQGDFGYPGDQQDFANVGENVGTGFGNPFATGAPFRPMQGATMKHDYLHASGPLKPELERLLKFEDEANLNQINRLTSYLNTQGDKKYVDPTHRMYVDNIFRNFEDFRGTGLWKLDNEKDPPKTMSSAIMGNQFVEGVGYR